MTKVVQIAGLTVTLVFLCAVWAEATDMPASGDRQTIIKHSRILLGEAQEAFAAGETEKALEHLEQVLEADPANPDAFYFIGLIKLSYADTSGAAVALEKGVELAPLSRRLKLLLARVWVEEGKIPEAEKLVDEVMSIRPRDLDALYIMGLIALAREDSVTAGALWESALSEELGMGER